MEQIFQILNDLNIPYELQEHKAIFSEEDSRDVVISLEGTDVKNLFVKDKNNNYGLVSLDLHKRADLKKIAAAFGYGRLSFCNPDELMKYLNITPGSVTPLCIMFDTVITSRWKSQNGLFFSFDIAILVENTNGHFCRLIHDKNWNRFYWTEIPNSKDVYDRMDVIKENGYWQEVRETYLNKKNMYLRRMDRNHPSFNIFVETINEVYYQHWR